MNGKAAFGAPFAMLVYCIFPALAFSGPEYDAIRPAFLCRQQPPSAISNFPREEASHRNFIAGRHSVFSGYVMLEGSVFLEEWAEKADYFHLDVYRLLPEGRAELARTGRVSGGYYKLFLDREFAHRLVFERGECLPREVQISQAELKNAGQAFSLDVVLLPVAPGPALPLPLPAEAPAMEERPALSLAEPLADALPVPGPVISPVPVSRHFTLNQDAAIHRDMGERSRVLARLRAGTEIKVLERTTPDWWMVACGGHVGWMAVQKIP